MIARETNDPSVLTTLAAWMSPCVRWSTNQARTAWSWETRPPPFRTSSAMSMNSSTLAAARTAITMSTLREGGASAASGSPNTVGPVTGCRRVDDRR